MSDNIPFEIQVEIIKRLSVKSLIQFTSVSKTWKSFIESPELIACYGAYNPGQLHTQRLFIKYKDHVNSQEKYVSTIDDDNCSQLKFVPMVPLFTKLLKYTTVFGCSGGLLCSYGHYKNFVKTRDGSRGEMVVLFNPLIRKTIGIAVPGMLMLPFDNTIGFGVCPVTRDPTIVKITCDGRSWDTRQSSFPWQVQVFTLSTGTWKILSKNLPDKKTRVNWKQVVIDRFIYWLGFNPTNLIMSFDMTTHEFRVVDLPPSLSHSWNLDISKVHESLVVLKYNVNDDMYPQDYDVWMMDNGVTKAFRKMYTVNPPCQSIEILGFTKNGEPIMETQYDEGELAELTLYDPCTEQINGLGIKGKRGSFFVRSYTETLLLIDQSNYRINPEKCEEMSFTECRQYKKRSFSI